MKHLLLNTIFLFLINNTALAQAFLETFDGNPSTPQSMYSADNWATYVHARNQQYALEPTIAHHGPNCEAPIRFDPGDMYDTTHVITAYEDAIYKCKNHLMTAIRADGYGLINMIPNQLIQLDKDSTIIRFDISTEDLAPGARDWFTFHITDKNHLNPLAAFTFAADLEGHPKKTLRLETHYNNGRFFSLTYIDDQFIEHDIPMISYQSLESLIDVSRVFRSTFELRLSQHHTKFGILLPSGDYHWWVDSEIDIPIDEAFLLLGHYSYNPRKGGQGIENTWHWDNIFISKARDFTIIHSDARFANADQPVLTFSRAVPKGSVGYFSVPDLTRTSEELRCSFDGIQWIKPTRIKASIYDSTVTWGASYAPYRIDIPPGSTKVQFSGINNTWQDWMAVDFTIFAHNLLSTQIIWDGKAGNTSWTYPMNWSSDEIPGLNHEVTIPSGHIVHLNTDAQIYMLNIELEVEFEVLPGYSLLIGSNNKN